VPLISDRWSGLTHGNPATVTKFVITSDWQGEKLTFDIYPPPRPTPHSILHWEKGGGGAWNNHGTGRQGYIFFGTGYKSQSPRNNSSPSKSS